MVISDKQVERYARHILLPEIGGAGQSSLLKGKVLVIGAGGLGSPVIMYLAAAGVGTIGIIDDDVVDLSNLQRQIIHKTSSLGEPKVESAKRCLKEINPDVSVETYYERLTTRNAMELIGEYDIVADGSDNFETRFLVNDACFFSSKILVSAAILRFDGQLSTFKAFENHNRNENPCYRCLFPEPPPLDSTPTCSDVGVLGTLCGVMGSLQASEILKELIGFEQTMSGTLLIMDGLKNEFRKIKASPDPKCALCSEHPTITSLLP